MNKRRSLRSRDEPFPEPNLFSFMDVLLLLIFVFMTMSSMYPLAFLSAFSQKLSAGEVVAPVEKEKKKPLNLIIFITDAGFNISVRGELLKKVGPLIPKIASSKGESEYDYQSLQVKLEELKALDNEEETMTITADSTVIFDVIVQTMDWSRYTREKKLLFPLVSFAAGVVG